MDEARQVETTGRHLMRTDQKLRLCLRLDDKNVEYGILQVKKVKPVKLSPTPPARVEMRKTNIPGSE